MKILLVEDDEIKRIQISNFLKNELNIIKLDLAKSLQSGIKKIVKNKYDLILLDMTMPTFDITIEENGGRPRAFGGREILNQMERRNINIPVIVVTQFDRFGEGPDSKTLNELDMELKNTHTKNYIGSIYYNSAIDTWKSELYEIINNRGELC